MKCKAKLYASSAMMAALVLGGYAAFVQSAAAQEMETVVVTGFRESLANALAKKEHSNLIIEAVAPEDIGKMPDSNVAESLQRLPGVQIDRADGEGTQIRIRGLSYNITTLDGDIFVTGREMYQTGEGSGGGNGNEFHNSMETIPSGLIAGIDVYKSPDASLVAGGIGGTINLHSRSALIGPEGFNINGIVHTSYALSADKVTPSANVIASYKFNDHLAVLGSISWDHTQARTFEMQAQNRSNWSYAGPQTGLLNTVGTNYLEPEMMYLTNRLQERKRLSTFLGVEYNPTEALQTSLKWYHTDMRTDTRDVADKINFSPEADGLGLVANQPYRVDPTGVVQYGTFASTVLELSSMVDNDKDLADNIQFDAKYAVNDKFNVSFKFAYGRGVANSQYAQQDQELSAYGISTSSTNNYNVPLYTIGGKIFSTNTSCGGNAANIALNGACTFQYSNKNGRYPVVSYTNPGTLADKDNGLFKSAWAWALGDYNTQTSYRADADYAVFDRFKVTGGLRYAVRALDYWFGKDLLWNPNVTPDSATLNNYWTYYQDPGIAGVPIMTFKSLPGRLTTINNFFPQAGIQSVVVQDPSQMIACPSCWLATQDNKNGYKIQFFKDPTNSFQIDNKNWSGYFMLDIGDADDALHVNTGVRVVQTQLTIVQGGVTTPQIAYNGSASWNGVPVAGTPTITHRNYTDILPSLNVIYNLDTGQKLRFAAARVTADPDYWNLGQGHQYYYTRGTDDPVSGKSRFQFDHGSSGNPNLDPFRANQVDLTYEYYFGKQGLMSVGLFWKGVESFTTNVGVNTVMPDDFGGTSGPVNTYLNGGGGRIEGVEINAQYAFDFGLGFNANYTYAQSKTQTGDAFRSNLPFPGVSNNAYTLQTYYETGPFEARVSYTWKGSSYQALFSRVRVSSSDTQNWAIYNRAYGQIDAQIGYKVLENLSLVAEGRNLGGDAPSQYLHYKNQPFSYDQSGRRFSIDVKFNY